MAYNVTLPPTVAEFRKVFPEFADVTDDQIDYYLFIGMQWVDTFWKPVDAKLAVMNSAAHFLAMQDRASGGEITSGGDEGGGSVDPEVGKVWIKSVRFRDRMVSYERVGAESSQATSSGTGSDAAEFWEATPYGKVYLSFLRRNAAHIAVI